MDSVGYQDISKIVRPCGPCRRFPHLITYCHRSRSVITNEHVGRWELTIIMPVATSLILPDLQSHCTFPLRTSRYRRHLSAETKAWFFRGRDDSYIIQCSTFDGLDSALLAAVTYPDVGYPQLRLCCDFITYLFFLDDLSDELDKKDAKSVADVVLNSLYHPHTYCSTTRISEMAKE